MCGNRGYEKHSLYPGGFSRTTGNRANLLCRIASHEFKSIVQGPYLRGADTGLLYKLFYKNMFAHCPAGRPGTADEIANVAELLMSDKGAFITGSTFLIDGGTTASYFYGSLAPAQ